MKYLSRMYQLKTFKKIVNSVGIIILIIIILRLAISGWSSTNQSLGMAAITYLESSLNIILLVIEILIFLFNLFFPNINLDMRKDLDLPLKEITIGDLYTLYGIDQIPTIIDRGYGDLALLRKHGGIFFYGEMKIGKTLESIQLINQIANSGLIGKKNIFMINPNVKYLNEDYLSDLLEKKFDASSPSLVFIDNITSLFQEKYLGQIQVIIDFLRSKNTLYIVSNDLVMNLSSELNKWIKKNGFYKKLIKRMKDDEIKDLVKSEISNNNVSFPERIIDSIAYCSDGIPGNIRFCVDRLVKYDKGALSEDLVKKVFQEDTLHAWLETKRYLSAKSDNIQNMIDVISLIKSRELFIDKRILIFCS